jgi:hypothetical protein
MTPGKLIEELQKIEKDKPGLNDLDVILRANGDIFEVDDVQVSSRGIELKLKRAPAGAPPSRPA